MYHYANHENTMCIIPCKPINVQQKIMEISNFNFCEIFIKPVIFIKNFPCRNTEVVFKNDQPLILQRKYIGQYFKGILQSPQKIRSQACP